jgi:2-C-methyl-D-erythritol 4-phosphate cytidylyltransferase
LPRDVGAIIVAAGQGSRFGGEIPKQYLPLGGHPVLLHALRPFVSHPDVASVVLVLPADDAMSPPEWLAPLLSETLIVTAGGASRRASVAAGLAALGPECEIVVVHDGARPFAPREVIDAGISCARGGHGAVPALPLSDTLKRADEFGRVLGTVAREGLWSVQTPQAFPRPLLERGHAADPGLERQVTDDAMLVEMVGGRVDLIPGSSRNIKITTRDDLDLATYLLGSR